MNCKSISFIDISFHIYFKFLWIQNFNKRLYCIVFNAQIHVFWPQIWVIIGTKVLCICGERERENRYHKREKLTKNANKSLLENKWNKREVRLCFLLLIIMLSFKSQKQKFFVFAFYLVFLFENAFRDRKYTFLRLKDKALKFIIE